MNLKEDLLRGIYAYGFEKPSAIQQRGIVPVIEGRDTIAQAQSGLFSPFSFLSFFLIIGIFWLKTIFLFFFFSTKIHHFTLLSP